MRNDSGAPVSGLVVESELEIHELARNPARVDRIFPGTDAVVQFDDPRGIHFGELPEVSGRSRQIQSFGLPQGGGVGPLRGSGRETHDAAFAGFWVFRFAVSFIHCVVTS